MSENFLERAELFADANRGTHIPRFFAETVNRSMVRDVEAWAWEALKSEDDPLYWDAWDHVLSNAVIDHPDLNEARLWHDGDLWIIAIEDV